MGGSRSQVNKAHKTRFASKASRHVHKTSGTDKARISKPNRHKGARAARIQRSKTIRDQKRAALLKEKRASSGIFSPPRVIVLFGLSSSIDLDLVATDLLTQSSGEDKNVLSNTVASPIYKFRSTILQAPHGDLPSCIEMAKVADLIAFVVSVNSFHGGCESGSPVDAFGRQCLSVFRAIGLPSTAVLIRDLPMDMKGKQDLKKMTISCLSSELPEDCKYYPADTKEDLHKFMWLFKEQHLSTPHWRNQRPYIMSQEVGFEHDVENPGKCTLLMSGYVRAHNLSVDQLVHVSGAGDFQLDKIDVLRDPFPMIERKSCNLMDTEVSGNTQVISTLLPDPLKQEPLLVENTPNPLAGEQTWPTEAEMAEADAHNKVRKLKRKMLPRGTSDYQAAWILEDSGGEDSDRSDSSEEGDGMVLDEQNGHSSQEDSDQSDIDDTFDNAENNDEVTDTNSEMADDDNLTKEQIQAEIKMIKDAAEDEDFPDEIDTPIDVPAKKRFAKYRGLKSFRTSSWDPKESLPPEYARIFTFDNFRRTQKHVLAKVVDIDEKGSDFCAPVGLYVKLHIKHVPVDVAGKLCLLSEKAPVIACGLLQHESKMSVLHFSLKKHDSYGAPIKSKETLVFHVGFRQFLARPLFSSDNMNCDKHKMERFLHHGCFLMASVYAPICFPPLPVVVLKSRPQAASAVAAVGSLRSVDPDRIVLKKWTLTGYPRRVSKRKAIVRFMFHFPDDVRWFKPVEVCSKKGGLRGRIKEPVGTHGAMKCVFNGIIKQDDTICMSLHKRAYPKWPEQVFPL